MDKKNVQNRVAENVLTDENFLHDIEKLSSQFKREFKNLLLYFFLKKLKNNFLMEINGHFRKCFYAQIMPEILL